MKDNNLVFFFSEPGNVVKVCHVASGIDPVDVVGGRQPG